jgi:hypothetical protein
MASTTIHRQMGLRLFVITLVSAAAQAREMPLSTCEQPQGLVVMRHERPEMPGRLSKALVLATIEAQFA